jgi:hypothetical protein
VHYSPLLLGLLLPARSSAGQVDSRIAGHVRAVNHRLVDEIVLLTYPVVVGQGTRLFPATGSDIGLELVDLQSTPKGLTIQTYRTTGRPQYETATT